ncbi:uncharacterized protein LOC144433242 [Glandiceps talaboti]
MADSGLKVAITKQIRKIEELFASGNTDLEILRQVYSEDLKIMAPGEETKTGLEGVADAVNEFKSAGIAKICIDIQEVGGIEGGDTAFERSNYEMFKEDGTSASVGKVLVIWKKANGVYRKAVEVFNTNK